MLLNQQFLFTPGPTPVPERIKLAMNQPMIAHRSTVFSQLLEDVSQRLKPIFGSEEPVYLISGSGTSALETAVANVVEEGDHVVVIIMGAFGDRFAKICETYGAVVHRLDIDWGSACDPEKLESFIKKVNQNLKAIFATYCETSTGVLNPIKDLGKVTKRMTDALFIVDGVSCIGAVPVDMKGWGIDLLVAGSQKALMLPPGLAFVATSERAKFAIQACRSKRFYLDLNRYITSYTEQKSTPFTPAVSLINGALEVCRMIEEEGFQQVIDRHLVLKDMVREGIKALGLPLLATDDIASPTVTAVKPDSVSANKLMKHLQQHFSITVRVVRIN